MNKLKAVDVKEAIIIGDTAYDAEAASTAGIKIIGVLSSGWTPAELINTGCIKVYKDDAEILKDYKNSGFNGKLNS